MPRLQDYHLDYRRLKWPMGPAQLNGFVTPAVDEGGAATFAEGALFQSPLAATVALEEVGGLGIVAPSFLAAGAHLRFSFDIPGICDVKEEMGVTLNLLTDSLTAGDAFHMIGLYSVLGATEQTEIAAPATALATPFAADTVGANAAAGTGIINKQSSRGVIPATALVEGGTILFDLEADVVAMDVGASESLWLLSVVFDFMPRLTAKGRITDAPSV